MFKYGIPKQVAFTLKDTMRGKFISAIMMLASCCWAHESSAQIVGGKRAFEFLNLSNSAHVTALGGLAPAQPTQDVTLAWQNPAFYRPGLHNQLAFNYNMYYADIKVANFNYAYHSPKLNTTFGGGVQQVNYGTFSAFDERETYLGEVRASDMVIHLSASRSYFDRWRLGATLKYAHSVLAERNAGAILGDIGLSYVDTTNKVTVGLVARNIGFMTQKYNPMLPAEPLPFDINIGLTKELQHLPLKVFVVLHHLYQWDIRYNNPADKKKNVFLNDSTASDDKSYFVDKLFRHVNLGAELTLGKRLSLTLAYNHLRRAELATFETKGMAGFSMGAGLYLNKLQLHFGRSIMATAGAYNEFGLNIYLDRFIRGKAQDVRTNSWSQNYPNW